MSHEQRQQVAARMHAAATLTGATLDGKTRLGDVRRNGVLLTQVPRWPKRLGDAQRIREAINQRERIAAYHAAAPAYRGLSLALHDQGLTTQASDYRLREQRLERRAQLREVKLGAWFFSAVLDLVAGHGERPGSIFVSYLEAVLTFAAAYSSMYALRRDAALRAQLGRVAGAQPHLVPRTRPLPWLTLAGILQQSSERWG
jgi:hypothetical protein